MPNFTTRTFLFYWLPVILWLGVIITESMSPFAAADQTSRIIVPLLHWLMPRLDAAQLTEVHHLLRKVGHFTGYGLLSYFFFRAWRGTHQVHAGTMQAKTERRSGRKLKSSEYWRLKWALLAIVSTALVATFDEVHQMTLANRGGSWRDVLLDTFGGSIFQVAIYVFVRYQIRTGKPRAPVEA